MTGPRLALVMLYAGWREDQIAVALLQHPRIGRELQRVLEASRTF